jgi:hypothetical protein
MHRYWRAPPRMCRPANCRTSHRHRTTYRCAQQPEDLRLQHLSSWVSGMWVDFRRFALQRAGVSSHNECRAYHGIYTTTAACSPPQVLVWAAPEAHLGALEATLRQLAAATLPRGATRAIYVVDAYRCPFPPMAASACLDRCVGAAICLSRQWERSSCKQGSYLCTLTSQYVQNT